MKGTCGDKYTDYNLKTTDQNESKHKRTPVCNITLPFRFLFRFFLTILPVVHTSYKSLP